MHIIVIVKYYFNETQEAFIFGNVTFLVFKFSKAN